MSARTDAGRRGPALIERLLDALTDPARRERTAVAVLLGYVALWTLYGVIAKGSQDIHVDMSEQFALARELALGYPKHPPLAMVVVRAWFAVFPTTDWAYYLLAMANAGLALWIAWRLAARFLDGDKRVVGLALLTLVPFFNFHALKFNVNTVLMPLWAATTLWFLRSFETPARARRGARRASCAAAAMYGKYWSVVPAARARHRGARRPPARGLFPLAGALGDDRGRGAGARPACGLAGRERFCAVLLCRRHRTRPARSRPPSATRWAISRGSLAYVAVPLVIVVAAARPSRAAVKDMAWPASPERRLAALAFWAVLLAPAVVAPLAGVQLVSLWSMSAWTLLPVMLLSSPLVADQPPRRRRHRHARGGVPVRHGRDRPGDRLRHSSRGPPPGAAHSSLLVEPIERLWRETTDRPLRVFAGLDEFTDGVSFYMPSHPLAVHVLDGSPRTRWRSASAATASHCSARATALAAERGLVRERRELDRGRAFAAGKQMEIEVVAPLSRPRRQARALSDHHHSAAAVGQTRRQRPIADYAGSSRQRSDRGLDQRDDVLHAAIAGWPRSARIRRRRDRTAPARRAFAPRRGRSGSMRCGRSPSASGSRGRSRAPRGNIRW